LLITDYCEELIKTECFILGGAKMCKWNVLVMILLSGVLAGSSAAAPLVYENFESYSSTGDLYVNWTTAGPGNPFLTPYLDSAVMYEGAKSMRLDSPLMDQDPNTLAFFVSDEDWGVVVRDDGTTTDVSAYNILTAMVRADSDSAIEDCTIEVRDVFGNTVGISDALEITHDGNWYKIIVPLYTTGGDKSTVEQVLVWFDIDVDAPAGSQLWVDDIIFDNMLAVNDILDVNVNGTFGSAGGTANYSFVMTGQPPADVDFTLTPSATLDFGAGFGNPVQIAFTPSNWNVKQYLTVNIDSSASGPQDVNTTISSTDPGYNAALPGSFNVQVLGQYGAPYVISPSTPPWPDHGDNTGINLANGVIGEIWLYYDELGDGYLTDTDWIEWAPDAWDPFKPAYAEITFDFGYAQDVNSVDIWHTAIDYNPPGNIELSYSTDRTTYTTPAVYPPYIIGNVRAHTRINVSPAVHARYVKLVVRCIDDNPDNWFFLSEVMFNVPKVVHYPSYAYDANNIPADTSVIYTDPYQTKLMDGAVCYITTDASFQQQGWVWFDNAAGTAYNNVILYADYGSVKEFSNLSLNYASDANSVSAGKLWAPSAVNLSFSNDGVTYGTPVSLTGWYQGTTTDATYGVTDAKTFTPHTGRYVKIQIARNTANAQCLRFGEIILSNRPQMTYVISTTTPVWGLRGDQPGDPAYYDSTSTNPTEISPIANLNFGDLADGYIPPTETSPYADSDWVEWAPDQVSGQPPYALITFDLKSVKKVKNVAIAYSAGYAGMPAPDKLEVAFSTNGTTFTTMVDTNAVFSNDTTAPHIYNTVFALPETQARYVQLKIHCRGDVPGNWIFISEVKFNVFTGDLNDDGVVDYKDLDILADQWLQSGSSLSANIAGNDTIVNFNDFAALAAQWLY
jgi:hypothetical protein